MGAATSYPKRVQIPEVFRYKNVLQKHKLGFGVDIFILVQTALNVFF